MARFTAGVLAGLIISAVAGAALGIKASSPDEVLEAPTLPAESIVAAIRVGLDARQLHAAAHTAGVDITTYLQSEGMLPRAPAPPPRAERNPTATDRLVDCIIWGESRGNPSAVNPRSGASGLGQFLSGTWRQTPQGQAGYSVFNAEANRSAIYWMLAQGRRREFVAAAAC